MKRTVAKQASLVTSALAELEAAKRACNEAETLVKDAKGGRRQAHAASSRWHALIGDDRGEFSLLGHGFNGFITGSVRFGYSLMG